MNFNRREILASAFAAAAAAAAPVRAATWAPTRPIDLLISFPAGGTADTLARYLAQRLQERQRWNVIVQNRPGGGGVVMHRALQSARPDGHTIGLCASYELTYTSQERGAAPFDLDEFSYVGGLARSPHCLVARPDSPLDSVEALRAHARKAGSVSIGVAAPFDWLAPRLGADLGFASVGVPFKGGAEMMQQVMGNQLDLTWSAGSHAPLVKGGKLKVVMALTRDRLPSHPNIPTARELGSQVVLESQFLVLGGRNLPTEAAATLSRAIRDVMADPGMQADVVQRGLIPTFMDGAQLRRSLDADLALARAIEAQQRR
ncbi:tripartite tricarboxylate transporter substrate binding protein [Ramlibacter sp.]|uniref:tripartite tricarboxylate transporter substrate binding protein n=1 Tax=Ramlibacter sp. TaxID=1917967 RepID=UPI003D0DF36E